MAARVPYVGIEDDRLKLRLHGWDFRQLERKLSGHDVRGLSDDTITLPLPARVAATGGAEAAEAEAGERALHEHVKKVLRALV